ncbi:MAG: PAS domain S-box protein, partial [Gammaproteobacteria bacterium]|nr:PAS domain S-box protein [Gammaproteobacteria bacterium]
FIRTGVVSILIAIVLSAIGAFLFSRITQPITKGLQESEKYNRMLFESSPIGLALSRLDGSLVDVNRAYANIIGFSTEEVKKLSYWDITPEDYAADEQRQLESLNTRGRYGPYEKEYLHKDGSRIAVRLLGQMIERDGEKYIWSSVEDIHERKETEAAIKLSEARLNEAQRLAKVGSWELDLLTGELVWSDEIFRIFEIDKEKFAATYDAFLNAIHPDDRDKVNEAYSNSLIDRKAYEITHRLQMSDGTIKYVHERCESFFDDDQKPVRSVGTVQDITKQKVVSQDLEQLKNILDQTLDCIFIFGAEDMRFYYVNEGAMQQVGYSFNELTTMYPYDIKPEVSQAGFMELISPLVNGEKASLSFETIHQHKDGTLIPVEVFLQYVSDENESGSFVAVVRDVTERKKIEKELARHREHLEELIDERTKELHEAQDELVRKERLATLGQLTATVSHELRNPLGAIRPSLFVVQKKSDQQDEQVQNAIERIDRNVDRCDRIIDELLDFTRITELNREKIRFDDWFATVIDEQFIPQGVVLEKEFNLKDVELTFDKDRLRRALINVIENASHSMMDDNQQLVKDIEAHLSIKTKSDNERIEIIISDTGCGIKKETLDKIFEPLFSTKGFGVGLGMPVVKQIMEQHDGGIDVKSEEGKGTTMTLWLPSGLKEENMTGTV